MNRRLGLIVPVLLLMSLLSVVARGAPIPEMIGPLPDGIGVNIHFTDPKPGEMKMIAQAGVRWVRMDFGWGGTERQKGVYDFAEYDRLMKALDEQHIRPIFILDYSNRNYDDDLSPRSDEGRAAFAKWAAVSAEHFKGRGVVWEMYNEPNIGFWRPKPNVDEYAKLAIAVGKALREATPDEPYIGPACSTMDFKFLEVCFKAGCLEYWSAVSVHPYRQKNPETVAGDYAHLRELIAQYAPKGKQIPIISGEWGYSAGWKKYDEAKQGMYLPRELLTNVACGVPISIWYDWHDDGTDPKEPEHHFGTTHSPYRADQDPVYEPKPAYVALKTLSGALDGCKFEKRIDLGNEADWALLFRKGDEERLAVWTTSGDHSATVAAPAGKYKVIDAGGEDLPTVTAEQHGVELPLTGSVKYLVPVKPGS
jgi:hypothetical protein